MNFISFLTSLFWRWWWGGKDWEDIKSLPNMYDKGLRQFLIIHRDTRATAGRFALSQALTFRTHKCVMGTVWSWKPFFPFQFSDTILSVTSTDSIYCYLHLLLITHPTLSYLLYN